MTASTYELDPVHSHLSFSVRHMMGSQQRGQFQGVTGTLVLARDNLVLETGGVALGDDVKLLLDVQFVRKS